MKKKENKMEKKSNNSAITESDDLNIRLDSLKNELKASGKLFYIFHFAI